MAVVVMIVGGLIGFMTGLVALIAGSGILASIALWVAVTIGTSVLAGIFTLMPRRALAPVEA